MRIGKESWIAVMARALFYGACMGALFGVLFGFVFAIVPGLMLAAARGYFRRHLRHARLSAATWSPAGSASWPGACSG